MLILVLGLALWWGAHFFKRAAPEKRIELGQKGKGLVTGALVISVILMAVGYKLADGDVWWGPSAALKGINNLLMLFAIYLFAASGMKTAITRHLRHPQLIGFSLWAVAHLLVNGDLPSLILFGGLLAWALAEMMVLNRVKPAPAESAPVPVRKEIMAVAGTVIVFIVLGLIHAVIGPNPFGG